MLNKFPLFLLSSVAGANLTSSLFQPNFLKIGSSFLSSVLITLSFLRGCRKRDFQFLVDVVLMGFLIGGLWSKSVDNVVHMFAIVSTGIYWVMLKHHINLKWFFYSSFLYLIMIFFMFTYMNKNYEEAFVVEQNYGCPNSFLEFVSPNN